MWCLIVQALLVALLGLLVLRVRLPASVRLLRNRFAALLVLVALGLLLVAR